MLMNRIGIGLSMLAPAPVLITDSLYWNVFSCWTEYIQWQKVAGPAWPVHGCIGPKNEVRQLQENCPASHQPSQITASCIFRPPNHVPASIDSFQTSVSRQIALLSSFPPPPPTLADLLISSEQQRRGVERLMYGDQTLPDGQIWDFRRRVNGRSRILTNSVSQSLILGWKAVTREVGAWDRPPNQNSSTLKVKAGQWQILQIVLSLNILLPWYFCPYLNMICDQADKSCGVSPPPALLHKVVPPLPLPHL